MNILVCVKQVRESADPTAARILNPADACALEAALRMRKVGDRVCALSMGANCAEDVLREAIALGADDAVLVTDPRLAGADTLVTAKALSAAAKLLSYSVILMGNRAVDGETGLTPFRMATLLGIPCFGNVLRVDADGHCEFETEQGIASVAAQLPAIFCLRVGSYPKRLMGIFGMRRAKNAVIRHICADELGLSAADMRSPTRVIRARPIPTGKRHPVYLSDARQILEVIAKNRGNIPKPMQMEASANMLQGNVCVVCQRPDAALSAWAERHCEGTVTCLRLPESMPDAETSAIRIAEILSLEKPETVLFSATFALRTIAPRVATILHTGITADCTALDAEQGKLLQIRPTWGGAQLAEILCDAHPQMALVREGALPMPTCMPNIPTRILSVPPMRTLGITPIQSAALSDADVILSGGKGVSRADFVKLRGIAEKLHGKIGASRAAVDMGLAPYSEQVGQTGHIVAPAVYMAIGISGAIQHILGMNRSGVVIAVNTDPKAPIFEYADYGIIGDGSKIIQQMEELL